MKFLLILFLLPIGVFAESGQPESESGFQPKEAAHAKKMMVASANPYATQAGLDILQKGGNAIDAAIAIQMVLNVVEPQSSGIGGGAFLLYYQKESDEIIAYDGREMAPQGVNEKWFLDENSKPFPLGDLIISGRSVGVPGVLKMLEMAHQERGRLPWRELFLPAIRLAEQGFPISSRLHQLIVQTRGLSNSATAAAYLFHGETPKLEGEILKNPQLARSLRLIAKEGTRPFYHGEIGREIVKAVQGEGGALTLEDLNQYTPLVREPLQTKYGEYVVYGFPPPSSGGIVIAQMLEMMKTRKCPSDHLGSPSFIDFFCGASRLSFADRDYYLADPAYFPVPQARLMDSDYLKKRATEIGNKGKPAPGRYPGETLACCPPLIFTTELELPSTTQICVIDAEGNGLSMTSSIENAFGSTLMAAGFFLNNQLTDFSLIPEKEGKKAANRIEPGKRPLSSMSPTLVFKNDTLYLTIGSAGGARIIDYVAKALLGVLKFDLNVQEAISFPNYTSLTGAIDLEKGTFLIQEVPALEKLGNSVTIVPLTSGTQGIQSTPNGLIGGADPRREGRALGK